MSRFCVTPVQALLDTRLSLRDLSVLQALGMHTDKAGWCFPSQARLGRVLGISQPAINRSLRYLREYGYIQIIHQFQLSPTGKKQQTANNTRILFDAIIPEEFQRKVDSDNLPPYAPGVMGGITPEVIGGITPEVIGGISPSVIPLTLQSNVPKNDKMCQQADTDDFLEADPKKAKDAAARNSCFGFDDFLKVYPRREDKKKAREAWVKHGCAKKAEKIIADVRERKARHGGWLDGFIPHPSTYINGERWNDDITPPRNRGAAESMF